MELNKFIQLRENLYHLTDEQNLENILQGQKLLSAAQLVKRTHLESANTFLRTRRVGHKEISDGKFKVKLRDQDPLYEKIVTKNLDGGWTFGDFVYSLNSRVFFWSTEKDLRTHYLRYENQGEFPKILCFKTEDIINANKIQPEFCHLNSGAPRCSAYHEKGAPPRGPQTFLSAEKYLRTPSSIREVTFLNECNLPSDIWLASHPDSKYKKL